VSSMPPTESDTALTAGHGTGTRHDAGESLARAQQICRDAQSHVRSRRVYVPGLPENS
jgi:hypothetical protein